MTRGVEAGGQTYEEVWAATQNVKERVEAWRTQTDECVERVYPRNVVLPITVPFVECKYSWRYGVRNVYNKKLAVS